MRKVAPFSIGSAGAATSATLMSARTGVPVAASAAAETPNTSASRRVMSFFMVYSLFFWSPALNRQ